MNREQILRSPTTPLRAPAYAPAAARFTDRDADPGTGTGTGTEPTSSTAR